MDCPFCHVEQSRIFVSRAESLAIWDACPLSSGHALIIPKHHFASIFDLPETIQREICSLVAQVRGMLLDQFQVDGLNIGINDGTAAGQTIGHAHIHLIPRYSGDVADPRGGVRWILPDKAVYWEQGGR